MTTTNNNTTVTIPIELRTQDILSAVADVNNQNAIGYWGAAFGSLGSTRTKRDSTGKMIQVEEPLLIEECTGRVFLDHKVTLDSVAEGIRIMATQDPTMFALLLKKDFGCELCDTIIQFTIFGKIKYG